LVDCAGNFDNYGCSGGLPSHAFEYISFAGGIAAEEEYVYTAKNGQCQFKNPYLAWAHNYGGAVNITTGDEVELRDALYTYGPIAIAFQVYGSFSSYTSGVYSDPNCGTTAGQVNHAVLAVGYGTDNGTDYWIVKNSWSADWGDQGYFKIVRGVNMCAIAQCNSFPALVLDFTQSSSFLN